MLVNDFLEAHSSLVLSLWPSLCCPFSYFGSVWFLDTSSSAELQNHVSFLPQSGWSRIIWTPFHVFLLCHAWFLCVQGPCQGHHETGSVRTTISLMMKFVTTDCLPEQFHGLILETTVNPFFGLSWFRLRVFRRPELSLLASPGRRVVRATSVPAGRTWSFRFRSAGRLSRTTFKGVRKCTFFFLFLPILVSLAWKCSLPWMATSLPCSPFGSCRRLGSVFGHRGALDALLAHPRSHHVHCDWDHWWQYRLVVFPKSLKTAPMLIFLAPIIFAEGYGLKSKKFFSNITSILVHAFVRNLPSTLVVAYMIYYLSPLSGLSTGFRPPSFAECDLQVSSPYR